MPLTSLVADAFGVLTLFLVLLFISVGVSCIVYVAYFRSQIQREELCQLRYFNAPWIARITLILYAILWSLGEIFRLSLLKKKGWLLHALSLKWQQNVCRLYVLSNLGLMEPGIFLTLIFLVHGSLHRSESFMRTNWWNKRVVTFVFLLCLPVFFAQFFLVVITPSFEFQKGYREEKEGYRAKIPKYFTRAFFKDEDMAFCTYPLFSTIVLGAFACLFISYFLYVGMRMISLVINKRLQRRAYWLILAVVGLLPLRVLLLGLSVLSMPGKPAFEVLVFLSLLALLLCAAVAVGVLVYWPVADSLAVRGISYSRENRRHQQSNVIPMESFSRTLSGFVSDDDDDSVIASHSLWEGAATTSIGIDSDSSTKGGSISFRTMLKDVSSEPIEEVNLFADTNRMLASPPGSPPLPGKPMISFPERIL